MLPGCTPFRSALIEGIGLQVDGRAVDVKLESLQESLPAVYDMRVGHTVIIAGQPRNQPPLQPLHSNACPAKLSHCLLVISWQWQALTGVLLTGVL